MHVVRKDLRAVLEQLPRNCTRHADDREAYRSTHSSRARFGGRER